MRVLTIYFSVTTGYTQWKAIWGEYKSSELCLINAMYQCADIWTNVVTLKKKKVLLLLEENQFPFFNSYISGLQLSILVKLND